MTGPNAAASLGPLCWRRTTLFNGAHDATGTGPIDFMIHLCAPSATSATPVNCARHLRVNTSSAFDLLSNFGTTKYDLGQQIRPIAVETHGALNATP